MAGYDGRADTTVATEDAHELARPLRPQGFGRRRAASIDDAIVEPAWPGVRIIAAVSDGRVSFFEDGEQVEGLGEGELLKELEAALERAVAGSCARAIFDGYLTKQLPSEGVGVTSLVGDVPTMSGQMTRLFVGGRGARVNLRGTPSEADVADRELSPEDVINVVLTDLLWLDGQWLLDVPLLERRRVLESVVEPSYLVRSGPFVRYPIDSWVASWRAQGFRGLTVKAANSRYHPGERSEEWAVSDLPAR
jgi:ATP dependent DNA ligase domain